MVRVNGTEFPMKEMSGLLVLEDPSGHQNWALISDATVEYGDAEFTGDEAPQMKVVATMKPGEVLRSASTIEASEENVLVYSRLLVALLREERDRYVKLERKYIRAQRERVEAIEQRDGEREDRDEMLRLAWRHGAAQGWWLSHPLQGQKTLDEVLELNPHPAPEEGCEQCDSEEGEVYSSGSRRIVLCDACHHDAVQRGAELG